MATRDPETRRRRLLDAALAEFAAYGISGARVDRIAKGAECSAGLVYTYFGSKEDLFDAVFEEIIVYTLSRTPITPDDLPEYAGRLFDGFEDNPAIVRLATWYRLERTGSRDLLEAAVASNRHKVSELAKAQEEGRLTRRYSPADLLGLVVQLARLWTDTTPEYEAVAGRPSRAHRRKVVTDAVAALLAD